MVLKRHWLINIALVLVAVCMWAAANRTVSAEASGDHAVATSRPARPDALGASHTSRDQRPEPLDQASRRLWSFGRDAGGKSNRAKDSGPREQAGAGEGPEKQPLTPAETEEYLSFTKQHFPKLHQQLERARQEDPRAYRQMLRRIAPPMRRLIRLWHDDPVEAKTVIELQNVEMQIREQKHRYHAARDEVTRESARAAIRKNLERRFDLRHQKLEREITDMRNRLDEQTSRLADQARNKEQIIEDEFDRALEAPRGAEAAKDPKGQGPASRPVTGVTY